MNRAGRLRHLAGLLRPYRSRVLLMLLSLWIATGAALVPPYLAGRAIDDGIRGGDTGALTIIVVAFVAAAVINWGATYVQTYLINWVGQRALQDLRLQLFEHLQRLSIGFYSRRKTGVLISRITICFTARIAPLQPPATQRTLASLLFRRSRAAFLKTPRHSGALR